MGGKYAKQFVNNTSKSIKAAARSSRESSIQAAKTIAKGGSWSLQMGIGSITSKIADDCSSAKMAVKSFYRKFF